jgi:thioredoxin-related protein
MKKVLTTAYINLIVSIMLIGLAIVSMSFTSDNSRGVRFQRLNYKEATHQAQYRKQPLFLFIGSNSCMESKRMEDIFKNKEVSIYFNTEFYCNKYDTDNLAGQFKAANFWGVKHYPTFLFFSKDGKLVYKEEGYHNYAKTMEMAQKGLAMIKEHDAAKAAKESDTKAPEPVVEEAAPAEEAPVADVKPAKPSKIFYTKNPDHVEEPLEDLDKQTDADLEPTAPTTAPTESTPVAPTAPSTEGVK